MKRSSREEALARLLQKFLESLVTREAEEKALRDAGYSSTVILSWRDIVLGRTALCWALGFQ
jgi:hypothetical protein